MPMHTHVRMHTPVCPRLHTCLDTHLQRRLFQVSIRMPTRMTVRICEAYVRTHPRLPPLYRLYLGIADGMSIAQV